MSALSNCYKVLGISRSASLQEIKTNYKKLAMVCHPDKNGGDLLLSKKFNDATEAYDILVDPTRRQQHDSDLNIHEGKSGQYSSYGGADDGSSATSGFGASGSGSWDYRGVYTSSQAGYDFKQTGSDFKGWYAPPPPPDHPLFDHETWRAMHYGDARTSTAGTLESGPPPGVLTGVFANKKAGTGPAFSRQYAGGSGGGGGGAKETTVQDVKENIVNRMDERRNERIKKEAELEKLSPEERKRVERRRKGSCGVS